MNEPSVSVIVPVLNAQRWIVGCIANLSHILDATKDDSEVIFVDNGSIDQTLHLLQEINDPRFKVICSPQSGIVSALNHGIAHARHEWIMRHDVDDFSNLNRMRLFKVALSQLTDKQRKELALVNSHCVLTNDRNKVLGVIRTHVVFGDILPLLEPMNPFVHGSLFLNKIAIQTTGGYCDTVPHAEDVELWCRLGERGFKALGIPHYLYWFRYHKQSVSSSHLDIQAGSVEKLLSFERDGLWTPLDRGLIRQLIWCDRRLDALRHAGRTIRFGLPNKSDLFQILRLLGGIQLDYLHGRLLRSREPEIERFSQYVAQMN